MSSSHYEGLVRATLFWIYAESWSKLLTGSKEFKRGTASMPTFQGFRDVA